MDIEEIRKLREEVLDIRNKETEEQKQRDKDNELRNKYIGDIEIQLNTIDSAKKKKKGGLKLTPKEEKLFYADYLELPYRMEDRFIKDIEEGLGLYPYNNIDKEYANNEVEYVIGIENIRTLLFFTNEDRRKYMAYKELTNSTNKDNTELKKAVYSDNYENKSKTINNKENSNNTSNNITIEYSSNNPTKVKVNGKEKCLKDLNKERINEIKKEISDYSFFNDILKLFN